MRSRSIRCGTLSSANLTEYSLQPHRLNLTGEATGILTGGNLSVLYSLSGTCYDPDTGDKILFLEDLSEYLYHIDRMIMNLKVRGKLRRLKALIIGGMHDMKSSPSGFRKPAYEIIREAVSRLWLPGDVRLSGRTWQTECKPDLGREVKLTVTANGCRLFF